MTDVELTQAEADALIAMRKICPEERTWDMPGPGGKVCIPLTSEDRREQFTLDISRGRIDLRKGTYQNRARKVFVLVRVDFGGQPHRNPDGVEIACPHIHLYREHYADKWAFELPTDVFSDASDLLLTLDDFLRYCNIEPPQITGKLMA